MAIQKEEALIKRLEKLAVHNDPINSELYKKYDVKRGLRNLNGTGVLVGLTRIGDVVGYEIKDGEKIAIPGKLIYRRFGRRCRKKSSVWIRTMRLSSFVRRIA